MTDNANLSLPTLENLTGLIRRQILQATTEAGSGHPTSSLSAVELMTTLMFGGHFRYDLENPDHHNNDRLIFSKGHASPLFYALWLAAGKVSFDQMLTYRDFDSNLEGHPTPRFPYCEAATGSLGQGLGIGLGTALSAKLFRKLPCRTFVLLGDSEMSEGSQWEAMELAAHYELDNLVGILDVNRLGQRGETMFGRDLAAYRQRVEAFGWQPIVLEDGHDITSISRAFTEAAEVEGRPVMIIAGTVKGKGVPEVEDRNGWHGKPLDREQLASALAAIGEVDQDIRGEVAAPAELQPAALEPATYPTGLSYEIGQKVATRSAFGSALNRIYPGFPDIISLDAEVSNSTKAETFKKSNPARFLEMFIAEQTMVGAATGLSRRGHHPFVSTFAAFFTRAFDQIRMSQYSDANIVFVGSHAGVSIGQDGPSQMGLEDIAMFRTLPGATVLYPADAVAAERLVEQAAGTPGLVYLRTQRQETPVIYDTDEEFPVGGCKVLRQSSQDQATLVAAGATLYEALAAYDILAKRGYNTRVIDLYSVQPVDRETLINAAEETGFLLTVEDHVAAGGLGEAVAAAVGGRGRTFTLSVGRTPRSGKPAQLRQFMGINAEAIVDAIQNEAP
jgi:transketolase